MIARYVLHGFRRHKMRTAIMVIALAFVSTMLVLLNNAIATSRRQMINLAAQHAGEHDIAITRVDTSQEPYIEIEPVSRLIRRTHAEVRTVYGRIQTQVEIARGAYGGSATLLARDPEIDTLGSIKVIDGEYNLEGDHIVILQDTAQAYNLRVGDEIHLNYLVPVTRERGKEAPTNTSVRRRSHKFTVAGIATQRGLDRDLDKGILANLATVQGWLGIPGYAERLVITLDPSAYDAVSTKASAVRVRQTAEEIRATLRTEGAGYGGEEMTLSIPKAEALTGNDDAFSIMRTLTVVYGFLSMGVVGLLVYSLINTNVDDRRRDLALMRIVGAQQRTLFCLVLIEVGLIGLVGVGLGILLGQTLSTLVVDRLLVSLLPALVNDYGLDGLPSMDKIQLVISPWSLFSTALIAGIVLFLSALAPAFKAATTKVRYAISPGSADSLQIEDLARLRERRFNWRITTAGLTLTLMWSMLFLDQLLIGTGDDETASVAFMVVGMILMVLGVSLLLFALTVPFERLTLLLFGWISPYLSFFAGRNVSRAKRRSTTIALMIVFSTALPTFLGTTAALSNGNADISARQNNGAPIVGRSISGTGIFAFFVSFFTVDLEQEGLKPSILSEFVTVPGTGSIAGLTQAHPAEAHNLVKLVETRLDVHAWTHSPLDVLYSDLTEMVGDGEAAFEQMFRQPDAIILTTDVAKYLDVGVGDTIVVHGKGKDHQVEMRIVGLVKRMPGFWSIGRISLRWGGSSPAFVSLDTYLRLIQDPAKGTICANGVCTDEERNRPVIERVFASTNPMVPTSIIANTLRTTLSDQNLHINVTQEQVDRERQTFQSIRWGLLALTVLSLITSVMGVFSVIYVTVQTRQIEIGMLKAIGITGKQLVGTLAIESLAATVSAALAGVTAGTGLGYVFYASDNVLRNAPLQPAFDWLTVGTVLVMVTVASLFSTSLASRGIVRRRVTEIMRQA